MSFDASSAATIIVAIITALGGYGGAKLTARSAREANEPANWQTLTAEMKAFFREQLEERDKRIDALENELGLHRDYLAHLEALPEFTDPPFISFSKWRAGR